MIINLPGHYITVTMRSWTVFKLFKNDSAYLFKIQSKLQQQEQQKKQLAFKHGCECDISSK